MQNVCASFLYVTYSGACSLYRGGKFGIFSFPFDKSHNTPTKLHTPIHINTHTGTQIPPQRGGSFLKFFAETIKPNLKSSIMSINSIDKPIDRAFHCSALETVYLLKLIKFYFEYLDL